jgi:23S rRNA pseudouridine2604 synthase
MNIELDVEIGKWRHLSDNELQEINRLVAESGKTV